MISILEGTADLAFILGFALLSCILAFAWSPILVHFLYRFKIFKGPKTELLVIDSQQSKKNTPVMGGLLVIITVIAITYFLNWSRSYTWVPIGVMILSAALGAIDDFLNVFGSERRSRKLKQVFTLIRVHKGIGMRIWYVITLPWSIFKRTSVWIGSRTSRGIYVHEKLLLQFIAGSITAWWIYDKLGAAWHYIYLPFDYAIFVGWIIIPIVILIVMFTANAVNIADGMDGLATGCVAIALSVLGLFGNDAELRHEFLA